MVYRKKLLTTFVCTLLLLQCLLICAEKKEDIFDPINQIFNPVINIGAYVASSYVACKTYEKLNLLYHDGVEDMATNIVVSLGFGIVFQMCLRQTSNIDIIALDNKYLQFMSNGMSVVGGLVGYSICSWYAMPTIYGAVVGATGAGTTSDIMLNILIKKRKLAKKNSLHEKRKNKNSKKKYKQCNGSMLPSNPNYKKSKLPL